MKRYFPVTMVAVMVLAVVGCTQDGDQEQTAGDGIGSGEVTTVESGEPSAAVEHTTLKPDLSEADDAQEGGTDASGEADVIAEEEVESNKSEEEAD